MENPLIYQKIARQLKRAGNLLLVAHQRPDADALGSLVALSYWLETLGKNCDKFCLDQPPANLSWLVNFEPLINKAEDLARNYYDTVVILDSGDLKYAGLEGVFENSYFKPFVINIDHHPTNRLFGDLNIVQPQAVSTTEIIYQIFKALKIKITPRVASALLAGIINDTYNFTNPNTSEQSLAIAAHLLQAGASLQKTSDAILKNKTIDTLKIWGEILISLNYNSDFEAVSTIVAENEAAADNFSEVDISEGVANFLNNLADIKAVLILQQQKDNIIKGSLRTNNDLIDVSRLAKILGGGGHRKAAGFRLKGKLVKGGDGHWKIQ